MDGAQTGKRGTYGVGAVLLSGCGCLRGDAVGGSGVRRHRIRSLIDSRELLQTNGRGGRAVLSHVRGEAVKVFRNVEPSTPRPWHHAAR